MDPATKLFLASAAGALNTANAYRPLARPGTVGSTLVMPASMLTSELPLQTIATQQLATLALAARDRGALRRPLGRAALALSAGSWVALARLHRESERAAAVLDAALADGLGAAYAAPAESRRRLTDVALARRGKRSRYLRAADVSYGPHGRFNLLDVWARDDVPHTAGAPVIVQIPGGAWVTGKKTGQAYPLLSHLAEQGWVGVSISYRLSPKARWPAHIVDVKRAIAWVRSNIGAYGGDPSFLAVTGGSAGGHLSALAGVTAGVRDFQPGFEDVDTSVQAAVPLYGVYDFVDDDQLGVAGLLGHLERMVFTAKLADDRAAWELASPQYHLRADAPPFFVIHGANDVFTSPVQARRFASDLRAVSRQPVVFAQLPYAQHAFDVVGSVRTRHTVHAIARFLDAVHARRTENRDAPVAAGRG
jgi:acetyl esterase/lipase